LALKRGDKGMVLRYLGRTTGYSRQRLTRLVQQCLATGGLAKRYRPPAKGFGRTYTTVDVALGLPHPPRSPARLFDLLATA